MLSFILVAIDSAAAAADWPKFPATMTKSKTLTEPYVFTFPMIPAPVSPNEPAVITNSKIFTVPSLLASPISLASYLLFCHLRRCF